MNNTAPLGWTNIDAKDMARIVICADLISSSTSTSGINDNASPDSFQQNIQAGRAALWLKDGNLVTVAFQHLKGKTRDHPERCPKFCVCAGIDGSLTPVTPPAEPYKSIRDAVASFATNHQHTARLHIWVQTGNTPDPLDWIYPIFQYAINNEIALAEGQTPAETLAGVSEDYSNQPPVDPNDPQKRKRWPASLTTWKLKLV